MATGAGNVADVGQQDLPAETLRRQLSQAYLALEALDEDRRRIIAERDSLKRALDRRSPRYILAALKYTLSAFLRKCW